MGPVSRQTGSVDRLQAAADWLSVASAWAAALCILGLTLLILAEILVAMAARFLSSLPSGIGFGWEYSSYLMGASFLLGSGLTLRAGLQLRVELLLNAGAGRAAWVLELLSAALGSVVTVTLTVWLTRFTLRTYGFGDVSPDTLTPLWIPQAVLALGAGVLAVQMVARLATCLTGREINRPALAAASAIE